MRDYLLVPALGTAKKDPKTPKPPCGKCMFRREKTVRKFNRQVYPSMVKSAPVISNHKSYVANDRQTKIDNFIMYYPYRGVNHKFENSR